ncbi:DNA-directed RNA polymerase, mitochondrial [Novymonas esmeraldas]|uniref:DNA-directed RNA polymerase n=1 Tax=Novymonas esmeraldas TaxID=1808958 RepID=A0AAW0EMN1_9TRYP
MRRSGAVRHALPPLASVGGCGGPSSFRRGGGDAAAGAATDTRQLASSTPIIAARHPPIALMCAMRWHTTSTTGASAGEATKAMRERASAKLQSSPAPTPAPSTTGVRGTALSSTLSGVPHANAESEKCSTGLLHAVGAVDTAPHHNDEEDDDDIAFSTAASAEALFTADELKLARAQVEREAQAAVTETPAASASAFALTQDSIGDDVNDPLFHDPFHVPSVDEDAFARDGDAPACGGASTCAAASAARSAQTNESVLAAVDMLCDDLYHTKTSVLRSFARARRVPVRAKSETVLRLLEQAHRDAHGDSSDLKVTRQLLGDVFDTNVRTSGVRSAWTNKSLEASHIEEACAAFFNFDMMANSRKTLMVRKHFADIARALRRLTRLFQQEQEQVSLAAVGGVFRNYRAAADELVHELRVSEVLGPFAGFLVSYVHWAGAHSFLAQAQVNDALVDMKVVQPTVQEVEDGTLLHRLMELLDPVVEMVERRAEAYRIAGSGRASGTDTGDVAARAVRAFSEVSHSRWNTQAAPEWVHDLAKLFCNWEAIVRNDLPRFAEVPRHFFDTLLRGVVFAYLAQRIYGMASSSAVSAGLPPAVRQSVRCALRLHFNDEEATESALHDFMRYVQASDKVSSSIVRGSIFFDILSQMQGAFQDSQEERSPLHEERVAAILNDVCDFSFNCTRSSGLFHMLVRLTEDMNFHFRFQRVYKRMSGVNRDTVRTTATLPMRKTLDHFEKEMHITPLSIKAVGFLVVQLMYLCFRSDGGSRPLLERFASVTGEMRLDVVGLTDAATPTVRDLHIAFPPQLSYNSWLNESDTREKSVYGVLPSRAVKGATNQAMIVSQAPMMKALDAISRVPWRINKYMLHVQEAVVREGFGFGKIRPGFYPLHYYSMTDGEVHYSSDRRKAAAGGNASSSSISSSISSSSSSSGAGHDDDTDIAGTTVFNLRQRRQSYLQQQLDWKELTELRSSRIHYLLGLRQARSIVQFSHIYFPNSMDFRGRMYPLPGRLNHTGSDPFRGLLEYAEPKPLGKVGLYWLKVHLANKIGMSKLSFDERVHYVDEHMEDVVQSAENPLNGDRWWQETSEPIQCLMACKEVVDAMKHSQGPEKFLSRLPVAVDGSYNGLQHYSAIGRDAFGASLVNLVPSERPADAYTGILKVMLESIVADAERDHQVAQRCLGSGKGLDKGHIKRKTIKRPIMTQVYGVTGYGMSEQIFSELVKQNKSHGLWTHTDMKEMSAYLRDKVLESLGVTFRETQNCRKWIKDVVTLLWKVQPGELRNALCWTTPLGLVVRQPYKVRNECPLFTHHGFTKVPGDSSAAASRKQLTAIAPNLIHSLDATHLAMTALEMQHHGLSMMAVHDSYWTYACDMPKLSQVLREQFVNLYSKYDPLWELKEQWEEIYFMDLRRHGVKLPDPPKRGDLDLSVVLNSAYFFS